MSRAGFSIIYIFTLLVSLGMIALVVVLLILLIKALMIYIKKNS